MKTTPDMTDRRLIVFAWLISCGVAPSAIAQTLSADPSLDWLMTQAKPAATTRETALQPPSSPLALPHATPESRAATLELSDGTKLNGAITPTPGRPLRVWDDARKEYVDLPFSRIKSIAAEVVWERDEREWQFKQAGSDEKVYSGKTYPAREVVYVVTLLDGRIVRGAVVSPVDFTDGKSGPSQLFVLHKRDKGEPGRTLRDLVYVARIDLVQTN